MSATATTAPTTITEQIDQANASGRTPVVFVHGLWLLRTSWDRWTTVFDEAGYAPVAADWPDDPPTVEAARANPDAFAGKGVAQPVDRGQGQHPEPRPRAAAGHLRREGPYGPARDRPRLLQAPAAQSGRHRVRRAAEPRPRTRDRQWLARGRRHGARVRAAV